MAERADPFRSGTVSERAGLFRREARAVAQQGWLIAKNLRRPPSGPLGPQVAVFVHGFLAAGPVFDPMRAAVAAHTPWETLDFNYGPLTQFDVIVERFARAVDERVPAESRLALVGHSLGGLICRAYIRRYGSSRPVERLITLATPHAGTRSVLFVPGALASALRPGSSTLEGLGTTVEIDETAIPHTAVVALADTMVTPPRSAGTVDGARVVEFAGLGHNELLFDARVHALVVDELSRPVTPPS